MEDFEKIKEVTLEEAQKILPKNIAYMTMKNGEIIIVNGLDHDKFDKRERDFEEWTEEQSKIRTGIKNFDSPLMKIQEDTPENERDSNLFNKKENLNNENNIQINLNQKYYMAPKNNEFFQNNNRVQNQIMDNSNNINYSLNNNQMNYRSNINKFPQSINYRNGLIFNDQRKEYIINLNPHQISQYRFNPNNITYEQFRPIPRNINNQIRNDMQNKGINKYVSYNNHSYVEIKK